METNQVYEIAELMEWMQHSPIDAVIQWLKNQGYDHEDIQAAFRLYVFGR